MAGFGSRLWHSASALALALAACASTGNVTVLSPMDKGGLRAYRSVTVEVTAADPSATNSAMHVSQLRDALTEALRSRGLFGEISAGNGSNAELLMRVTIETVAGGGSAFQLGSSDAEATVSVELINASSEASVTRFRVTGNSKSNTSVRVGGVDTKAMSDQTPKALATTAEHIADHLKDNG